MILPWTVNLFRQGWMVKRRNHPRVRRTWVLVSAQCLTEKKLLNLSDHQFFYPVCEMRDVKASCKMLSFSLLNINTYNLHSCLTKQNMLCIFRIILLQLHKQNNLCVKMVCKFLWRQLCILILIFFSSVHFNLLKSTFYGYRIYTPGLVNSESH